MPLAKSGALSPDEFSQIGREGKDGEHAEQRGAGEGFRISALGYTLVVILCCYKRLSCSFFFLIILLSLIKVSGV